MRQHVKYREGQTQINAVAQHWQQCWQVFQSALLVRRAVRHTWRTSSPSQSMSMKWFSPGRENIILIWIYNNQKTSTGPQSAFSLMFRQQWEGIGRAERLQRSQTGWQTGSVRHGTGIRWLQWEYQSSRQGTKHGSSTRNMKEAVSVGQERMQTDLKLWISCVNRNDLVLEQWCRRCWWDTEVVVRWPSLLVWGWRVWECSLGLPLWVPSA